MRVRYHFFPARARTLAAAALAVMLAGCGLTPVHGVGGIGAGLWGTIRPADPEHLDDFTMVHALEERMGHAHTPRYRLDYQLDTNEAAHSITRSNDTTRFNVQGTVRYSVIALKSDTVAGQGTVHASTTYLASGSPVATMSSQRDAKARLIRLLALKIVTRLSVTLGAP